MQTVSNTIVSDKDARVRKRITLIYYAGFIALGLTAASLGPTLKDLGANTGSPLNKISILFTARSLGYLLGSVLAGRLYDRLPGHTVMFVGLAVVGITLAAVPVIPFLALLAVILLVTGIAEGLFDVGGNTLIVWVHKDKVSPYMNALHFFFGIGAFVSPMIIDQAKTLSGGIHLPYWILSALALLASTLLLTQPTPLPLVRRGERAEKPANSGLLSLLMVFFFLYVGAEVAFGGWIFTYASEQGLAGETAAAYLTSAFWGAFTLGRLLSIPIAKRIRPRTVLLIDLLGCALSLAFMFLWSNSVLVVWVGAVGTGLFMASIFPTAILLAGRRITITGFITSLFFLGSSTGGMLIPLLIGQFFVGFGPPAAIGIIFAAVLLDIGVLAGMAVGFKRTQED